MKISGGIPMQNTTDFNYTMPQFPESYWLASTDFNEMPKLTEDIEVDVAVVGGGITGITNAYLLAKEGYKVALLEAGRILNGTTGHTTAKITAQHDLIYDEFINHFGEEKARLYYEATSGAKTFIEQTINDLQIECELKKEDAYIYTTNEDYVSKIENEVKAYERLGIQGGFVEDVPLPLDIRAAIVMKDQYQFHPLAYLKKLVEEFLSLGGKLYEKTTAVDVIEGNKPTVLTRDGHRVISENVVCCTHFPFYDGLTQGAYFSRMYAERSYVLAVKMDFDFPGGMYLSAADPKRSLRTATINGEEYVLLSGQKHKTGQGIPTILHYEALKQYGEEKFGLKEIAYRWSAQDLTTLDKMPYIGRLTHERSNVFVATGYRKWGMTNGTAAALLLRDLVMVKDNPYELLYSPSRFVADPSVKNFIKENVDVAKHLLEGKLEMAPRTIDDLENDEGSAVVFNGKRAGAYKDQDGQVHIVDTTCKHMGCEVEWNHGERTWDCPCHGSRYSYTGEVVEGPAKQPLDRVAE